MASNNTAYDNFVNNILSVRKLVDIYKIFVAKFPLLTNDAEEILRYVVVGAVSALDSYMHDFFRIEIIEAIHGTGMFSVKLNEVKISTETLKEIKGAKNIGEEKNLLSNELMRLHRKDSFQSAKSIEFVFATLGVNNIWSKLNMGIAAKAITGELGLIVERRNKISHEADFDHINYKKNPIHLNEGVDVIDFIDKLVGSINSFTP